MPGAASEPLAPKPPDLVEKTVERSRVARDPIVAVVTLELAAQRFLSVHAAVGNPFRIGCNLT